MAPSHGRRNPGITKAGATATTIIALLFGACATLAPESEPSTARLYLRLVGCGEPIEWSHPAECGP